MAPSPPRGAAQGDTKMARVSREAKLARVTELRAAALVLLERRGRHKKVQGFPHPVRVFEGAGLSAIYRTPAEPVPFNPKLPISREAQRALADDYALDIFVATKVLNISWNDEPDPPMRITAFKRGAWEDELLALAAAERAGDPGRSDGGHASEQVGALSREDEQQEL